jgi:4-coumarate--CoA ligase
MDDASRIKTPSIEKLKVSEQEARKAKPIKRDFNSTAILAFSSGTTGLPKAVELTHKNLISMRKIMDAAPSIHSQPSRSISILPFFHVMGMFMHVFKAIPIGDTVHMQVPFNAQLFLKLIKQENIQVAVLAHPIIVAFAKHPAVTKELFSSMIQVTSGGGPLDEKSQTEFAQKTQTGLSQGWGMTEVTLGCIGTHYDTMPGTWGCVLPGNEMKSVDPDTGESVGPCKRGEIWLRGPTIFKGYYNNPKATKETMSSDGYLKSGDIAIVNEQGHFTIVDRIKDLIKYKGFQVAPTELEALINQHPKVALSAVIGIYSQEKGTELPRAYVQLRPNIPAQGVEEEIQENVKANASNPKWLRGGVRIVPAVPVSPSGKVLRKELRVLAKKEEQGSQPIARL